MANFWTINEGCYCDFKFQKADLLVEGACSENDLKNGCVDIKGSNQDWLSIINGKKYCAKQTHTLNLLKMKRAIKDGDTFKC